MRIWKAVFCIFLCFPALAVDVVKEPETYRQDRYRAPVPGRLSGVTVIDSYTSYSLWLTGQLIFIDVMPHTQKPPDLPEGTIWREKPRHSIPGSFWFPDTGYGELADSVDRYFRSGLLAATAGKKDQPILFFCLADCWMSWNAAKRAREYGYSRVFWFPDGSDGWSSSGYDLEQIKPWREQ